MNPDVPPRPLVLVVDDESYVLDSLRRLLDAEGFECLAARSARAALELLRARPVDAVLTDLSMPGEDGIWLLRQAGEMGARPPVVVLTGAGSVESAVLAMKEGALDFLQKPFEPEALLALLRRAVEHGRLVDEVRSLRASVREFAVGDEIVGNSAALEALRRTIAAVATTDSRVLLVGETGTGKELVAHAIHAASRRARKPFVRVNCAAIPETLFESELFGHRRGAFTGAHADRPGSFAEAHGGTLALDEVGTLAPLAQAKLLRAIETGEYQPVGEARTRHADVRIVAITNEDLAARVREGTFREDLLFRLNVVPVRVPPLREHKEDLPALAAHFLALLARRDGTRRKELAPGAVEVLASYDWPGNVRELRNALERAAILSEEDRIGADVVGPVVEGGMRLGGGGGEAGAAPAGAEASLRLRERTNALERSLILEALRRAGGRKGEASVLLGIDPSNFAYYAKKHQLGP